MTALSFTVGNTVNIHGNRFTVTRVEGDGQVLELLRREPKPERTTGCRCDCVNCVTGNCHQCAYGTLHLSVNR